jgi:hypothetical protein
MKEAGGDREKKSTAATGRLLLVAPHVDPRRPGREVLEVRVHKVVGKVR